MKRPPAAQAQLPVPAWVQRCRARARQSRQHRDRGAARHRRAAGLLRRVGGDDDARGDCSAGYLDRVVVEETSGGVDITSSTSPPTPKRLPLRTRPARMPPPHEQTRPKSDRRVISGLLVSRAKAGGVLRDGSTPAAARARAPSRPGGAPARLGPLPQRRHRAGRCGRPGRRRTQAGG